MGQITVTQHEGYAEYRLIGAFDDDNAHHTLNDLWTATDYEFTHNELYDYSLADFTQLTGAGIRKIVHLRERLNTDKLQLPTAMLATRDVQYGFSRMLTTLNENRNPNVRVFRDRDEAIAWVSSKGAHLSKST